MNAQVNRIVEIIRKKTDFIPKVGLILGSGLGGYADEIDIAAEIPYRELEPAGFPVSTAPGHVGRYIFGYVGGTPVICMQGRVHLYEGYPAETVVLPVRVMKALGAEILFITNASGGISEEYTAGCLAMITDQINVFVPNPLIGPNDEDEGVRFPDMTAIYDPGLRETLMEAAAESGIDLKKGVYCQLTGPSFETPSDIRLLKLLGADMVGMSSAIEAITARHMGMRVCGVSLISNLAAGISPTPLTSEEVNEAGRQAGPRFTALVTGAVRRMQEDLK